jgi:uncharacterized protein YecE (DUF72 family)
VYRAFYCRMPRMDSLPGVHLGTSAFTADGWQGSFYPADLKPAEYLTYYATKFDTVEVDSTFYRTPSSSTVRGWHQKTPKGFLLAARVPREITHEKVLKDCEADFKKFLDAMDLMSDKLGPLLFQFAYFNKGPFKSLDDFLALLVPFLKKLPKGYKFAVEIRNKNWLVPKFADVLRERGVALALIDQAWMPRTSEWFEKFDPITANFAYIRWLGDRKGIEKVTKTGNKTIVNRNAELAEWVEIVRKFHKRKIQIFAYANNHYAGYAPATVEQFKKLYEAKG